MNNKNDNNKEFWKTISGNILIWLLIIVMSITALQYFSTDYKPQVLDYTEFQQYVNDGVVESGVIIGRTFKGKFSQPILIDSKIIGKEREIINFTTVLPEVSDQMTSKWIDKGIKLRLEEQTPGVFDYLLQFSPWILIILFWFFFVRKMQGGGGNSGIFNFAKSRAKIISPDKPKTTFKDVAGCDEAKVELQEIVEFLKHSSKYKKLGAKIPKGAL